MTKVVGKVTNGIDFEIHFKKRRNMSYFQHCWESRRNSEPYFEPSQTSMMKLSGKNSQGSIVDVGLGSKHASVTLVLFKKICKNISIQFMNQLILVHPEGNLLFF